MRRLMRIFLLFVTVETAFAQDTGTADSFSELMSPALVDSIKQLLSTSQEDSSRVILLHRLSYAVLFSSPDSALYFAQEGLKLARLTNYKKGEVLCKTDVGAVWWIIGEYSKANEILLESVEEAQALGDPMAQDWSLSFLVTIYRDQGNYEEALKYSIKGTTYNRYFGKSVWNTITGSVFQEMNEIDSALFYLHQGDLGGYNLLQLGHTYAKSGNKILASDFYTKSIPKLLILQNFKDLADAYIGLARLYEKENNIDSSIYFANKGFIISQKASFKKWVYETGLILSRVYEKNDARKALYYHKLAIAARDSMFNLQNITQSLNARFNEQLSKQQTQTEKMSYQNKMRTYILLGALTFFLLVAVILWRNNRQKQKAKTEIEIAYKDLKSAQAQLIQSEKMASLGELTAGIAHEIQNPLNFVNNFSDVNKELVDELQQELKAGKIDDAISIANDIKGNEEKINHHGKRADGIVKGMLQHSRSSSGIKEPTDINALCDEYLRLSYHGLRAKDKSFNAIPINIGIETNFDPAVGKVNVIPQDIGRVILNLINNAFYAVAEKKKKRAHEKYEPTVTVTTRKSNGKIQISIKDNGNGIPDAVKEKIFQPFFTTKPTGQGTGLGLSLSYDIVTKGHGGELKVESIEGGGTELITILPI